MANIINSLVEKHINVEYAAQPNLLGLKLRNKNADIDNIATLTPQVDRKAEKVTITEQTPVVSKIEDIERHSEPSNLETGKGIERTHQYKMKALSTDISSEDCRIIKQFSTTIEGNQVNFEDNVSQTDASGCIGNVSRKVKNMAYSILNTCAAEIYDLYTKNLPAKEANIVYKGRKAALEKDVNISTDFLADLSDLSFALNNQNIVAPKILVPAKFEMSMLGEDDIKDQLFRMNLANETYKPTDEGLTDAYKFCGLAAGYNKEVYAMTPRSFSDGTEFFDNTKFVMMPNFDEAPIVPHFMSMNNSVDDITPFMNNVYSLFGANVPGFEKGLFEVAGVPFFMHVRESRSVHGGANITIGTYFTPLMYNVNGWGTGTIVAS